MATLWISPSQLQDRTAQEKRAVGTLKLGAQNGVQPWCERTTFNWFGWGLFQPRRASVSLRAQNFMRPHVIESFWWSVSVAQKNSISLIQTIFLVILWSYTVITWMLPTWSIWRSLVPIRGSHLNVDTRLAPGLWGRCFCVELPKKRGISGTFLRSSSFPKIWVSAPLILDSLGSSGSLDWGKGKFWILWPNGWSRSHPITVPLWTPESPAIFCSMKRFKFTWKLSKLLRHIKQMGPFTSVLMPGTSCGVLWKVHLLGHNSIHGPSWQI